MHILLNLYNLQKNDNIETSVLYNFLHRAINLARIIGDAKAIEIYEPQLEKIKETIEKEGDMVTNTITSNIKDINLNVDVSHVFNGKGFEKPKDLKIFGHAHRLRFFKISEEEFSQIEDDGWTVEDELARDAVDLWLTDRTEIALEGFFQNITITIGDKSYPLILPETIPVTHLVSGQHYLGYWESFKMEITTTGIWSNGSDKISCKLVNYDFDDAEYCFVNFQKNGNPFEEIETDSVDEGYFTVSDSGEFTSCEMEYISENEILISRP